MNAGTRSGAVLVTEGARMTTRELEVITKIELSSFTEKTVRGEVMRTIPLMQGGALDWTDTRNTKIVEPMQRGLELALETPGTTLIPLELSWSPAIPSRLGPLGGPNFLSSRCESRRRVQGS